MDMMQTLPRTLPPLPLPMDRAFLAGASPCSKVSAVARRKRDFRDAGFRGGCATRAARRAQEAATDSSEVGLPNRWLGSFQVLAEQPGKPGKRLQASSSSGFTDLINELLYGAASRLERGQATCRACKGTGTLECSTCQVRGSDVSANSAQTPLCTCKAVFLLLNGGRGRACRARASCSQRKSA